MFEKEIKFISDFNLNRIKNLGSFFTFEKLNAADLHPAIVQYISAELDYLIYEDRQKLLQKSVFDYSGQEISKLFQPINIQLKKTKRISYEDIKKLVLQAVSFNINFLARPKWSLTKLVYDNQDVKSVDEIKLMFNYLYYYDYLRNIFLAYIDKRKILTLSLAEFEIILNKIDKEIFSPAQSKQMLDNAIYSMGEFLNIGGTNKSRISAIPVEIFLKEKNLIDYLFRLRRALPPDSKGKFEIEEIRSVMYSVIPLQKQQILSPEKESEEEPVTEQTIEPEITSSELIPGNDEEVFPELEAMKNEFMAELDKITSQEIESAEDTANTEELEDEDLIIGEAEDEELLKMYDEELKEFESAEEIKSDEDEIQFDLSEKEHLDEVYDFEDAALEANNSSIEIEDEKPSDKNLEEEIQSTGDYNLKKDKEEMIDDLSIGIKKLDVPEDIDEEEKVEEEAELKQKHELRTDEFDSSKDDTQFVSVPEEKKKTAKKNFTKDIFSYLSNKDIEKITTNVFNEDRDDFTNTLERISDCETYDEATEILKGVFFSYRVNPYSRDAVTLTNAVSNYFNQV